MVKLTMLISGAVLLLCVVGIVLLSAIQVPVPTELSILSTASFAYLTGSVVTAGQLVK